MIPPPEVRELTLREYFEIVLKRAWVIGALVLFAVVVPFIYSSLTPDVYEATAKILVKESYLRLIDPNKAPVRQGGVSREDMQAQIELMTSPRFAERIIQKLNVQMLPAKILSMIEVTQVPHTNLIDISARGSDPIQTATIVNTWVNEFVSQDVEKKMGLAKYGVLRLEKEIDDTLKKLQDAELELAAYLKEHGDLADQEELVARLKEQKIKMEEEVVKAAALYKEKHQKMISLKKTLENTNEELKTENERLWRIQEELAGYNVLKKRAEAYRKIYEDLITRSKQLDTAKGLEMPDVSISEFAKVPEEPAGFPMKLRLFLLFGSIFLGISLCFYLEMMDLSLKTPEEVEFYSKMPFLRSIPFIEDDLIIFKKDKYLVAYSEPFSAVSEDFRNLKTALVFTAAQDKPLKTIMVTSSIPREGKSFVASNLAISFSKSKEPTLLVDGDMRQCSLLKSFGEKGKRGLIEILEEKCGIGEAINPTPVSGLSFLCAGVATPRSTDLLSRKGLDTFFEEVRSKFQRIIIDVPAVLEYGDALFWADKCDAVVYVIESEKTSIYQIEEAKKKLGEKLKTIGVVLNKVKEPKSFFYRFYQLRRSWRRSRPPKK